MYAQKLHRSYSVIKRQKSIYVSLLLLRFMQALLLLVYVISDRSVFRAFPSRNPCILDSASYGNKRKQLSSGKAKEEFLFLFLFSF